ncbi:MYG1 family protein, partial [Fournierella sp.]|uniref:MYG1 family protein n=1 Tax=Allofournierella sp. TaxID=1940256 RepID=UPI0025C531F6
MSMQVPKNGFTHGGKFHADDVFSTALLRILRPDFTVTRGFSVPENFDGIVYDIGNGPFDHHAADRAERPNGIPYAAFGLLWKEFGAQLVGENQARLLDENFVQPLDLNDNTGESCLLADAIGGFNPLWDQPQDPDACFARAVDFAQVILENNIEA